MLTEFAEGTSWKDIRWDNIEMELRKVAVGMTICCWVRVMSSSKLFI